MPRTLLTLAFLFLTVFAQGQTKPTTPEPDLVIFVNGEQLTGELEKADGSGITFKSAMAGEIVVKWANVKDLRSKKKFAVLQKDQKLNRSEALNQIPTGQVSVADQQITVASKTIPVAQASQLVDGVAFEKAVRTTPGLLQGWTGPASFGVSIVRATEDSTTFNGSIALTRANPQVDWLPPRDRTILSYTQSYGNTTQTGITPIETNIFHANAERDEYIAPRLFLYGTGTFDHNFSQNLGLEAAYGGGIGTTLIKSAKQELDVKADVHYLEETFFVNALNPTPSPNVNVVASSFSETYARHLPKGLLFNEFGSVSPAWTNEADFAAHVNGTLVFPVYRGLGFNITAIDDFLNNAPAGTRQNSTQLNFGLSYTIKPR